MKRSQINLTDRDRLRYLKAISTIRWAQLEKEKQQGRISEYEQEAEQLAILEMIELIEAWRRQGYNYTEILKTIEDLPPRGRREVKQKNIQFPY